MKKLLSPLAALAFLTVGNLALGDDAKTEEGFNQAHTTWNELVGKHVKPDGVSYPAFQKDRTLLKSYLSELAQVSTTDFNTWSGREQLAYFINLYNAATIDLVLEHYPIKSFKDEAGGEDGPWKLPFVKALGKTYTLDQVEHELIRKNYPEPRIHFAVNCASGGCPPVRNEAFTGENLETQLEEQTKAFLSDKTNNRLRGKTLELSPIFEWFAEDFVKKSGSVEAFVSPYFGKELKKGAVTLKYTDYSWALNEASAE